MSRPQSHYTLYERYEALRALAFRLLMSDEIRYIDGPNASALFDRVGDMTEEEAASALRAIEAIEDDRISEEVFDPTDPTSRMYEDEVIK